MANEIFKELKTRIALKYNTYEYWVEGEGKDYAPLKGEVCFCAIESKDQGAQTAPTVLFKVGVDGQTKFSDLKWTSALAADVYEWAKVTGANVFTKDGVGNVVSGIEYDATLNGGKGGFKFTTASVATAEGLEELQEAVAAIEKDITDNRDAWNKYEDTRYSFSTDGDKLVVKKTLYTNGVAGTEEEVGTYEFLTADEVGETLKGYYTKGEVDGLIQGVKDIVNGLDESITTVTEGTGISVTDSGTGNDHAYTVELNVDGAKTALGLGSAAYVTVESLNETAKGYADAVEAKIPTEVGVMSISGDTASGVVVEGTKDVTIKIAASTYDAYGAAADVQSNLTSYENAHKDDYTNTKIDELIQGAKDYADNNDANTEYHVEYDSTNKKIKLVAGADASKMEIDATAFIKDGMIQSVELVQEDGSGNKGQFLKLTWNDDGNDVTYVPVGELVDVYTGSNGDEVNVAISNTNVVSASLNTNVATKITHGEEAYGWGNHANAGYAKVVDLGDLAGKDKIVEGDIDGTIGVGKITNFATEVAGVKVTNAGHADSADSATDASKLGGQLPSYYATAESVTDITKDGGTIDSKISAYDEGKGFGDIITHNDAEYQKYSDTLKGIADRYTVNTDGYFNEPFGVGSYSDGTAAIVGRGTFSVVDDRTQSDTVYGFDSIERSIGQGENAGNYTYSYPNHSGTIATEGWVEGKNYLTEVTTTENNGLKVTNKNHIDIDTDVVFVLDCNW